MTTLADLIALLPEYSVSKGWLPQDSGWQQAQLSFLDDALNTSMDKAFVAATGGFDPTMLDPTEEEVEPAVTQGRDRLMAIMQMSPGTPQARMAAALLDGMSPEQAVEAAQIAPAPKLDRDGKPVYDKDNVQVMDTAAFDDAVKWARGAWDTLLGDKPAVTRQVDHPLVQWAKENNLPDPRDVYSAAYVDPQLQSKMDASNRAQQEFLSSQARTRSLKERERQMVAAQRSPLGPPAPAMSPSVSQSPSPQGAVVPSYGRTQTDPRFGDMNGVIPQAQPFMQPQPPEQPNERPVRMPGMTDEMWRRYLDGKGWEYNEWGQLSQKAPAAPAAPEVDIMSLDLTGLTPSNVAGKPNMNTNVPGWSVTSGRGLNAAAAPQVDPKAIQASILQSIKAGSKKQRARNTSVEAQANANALASFLQSQGRTPIGDAMLSRIAGVTGRG